MRLTSIFANTLGSWLACDVGRTRIGVGLLLFVVCVAATACGDMQQGQQTGPSRSLRCDQGFDPYNFRFETAKDLDAFAEAGCRDLAVPNPGSSPTYFGMQIYDIDGVRDLEALNTLESVPYYFEIAYTTDLTTLDGLDSLTHVGMLSLIGNHQLQDISALGSITGAQDLWPHPWLVYIADNDQLSTLEGLGGIEYLMDHLIIEENDQLESLAGLESLRGFRPREEYYETKLIIRDNPNLPTCEAEAFAAGLDNVDVVVIEGNDDTASCE